VSPAQQVSLWNALRQGCLFDLVAVDGAMRFRVVQPALADRIAPGTSFFYCSLGECSRFEMQPIPNETIVIQDTKQIERMELKVAHATEHTTCVVVTCMPDSGMASVSLRIRAASMTVWNAHFDDVTSELLRGK
jgi:hypothetical protein